LFNIHLTDIGFRHIHLDHQRIHVRNIHNRRFRIGSSTHRCYNITDVGILGQYKGVKRRSNDGIFQIHGRHPKCGTACFKGRLLRRKSCPGRAVACLADIIFRHGNVLFRQQLFIALVGAGRICQLGFDLFDFKTHKLKISQSPVTGSLKVITFEPGNLLTGFDGTSFFNRERNQAGGYFGRHRRFTLGHHITAGIEQGIGFRRIKPHNPGNIDFHGQC